MKKVFLAVLLAICFSFFAKAQEAKVTGLIRDSTDNIMLKNASISVLRAKDSILVKFTRANTEGKFNIDKLKPGNYLLLITYPDYADYIEKFSLEQSQNKDFGNFNLLLKSRLLQDVIFKGEAVAIRVKGDTTEFNAGSFKVEPNAKVEDLLKQLPGIQVDQDGKITAQGETVTRVLVDGEEFFGDDPTLVTKNIRSDMVDKVQLYDDKSENAKFTGIDDGVKNKTINLKLKEDKKKGLFGKIDLGLGNDEYYTSQGLLNFFNNKKKISFYSTLGNTNRTGLDFRTSRKAGLNNIEINDDGAMFISPNGGNDAFSRENFYGEGVPEIINTGVHFENKWKEDKHSINLDYKYGRLDNVGFKDNLVQNNLPNSTLLNTSNLDFDNLLNLHRFNIGYEIKIDTSSNIKLTFDNSYTKNSNSNTTSILGLTDDNLRINDGLRVFNENIDESKFNTSLFYGKKFKKEGRTLTFRFNQSYYNSISEGLLNSTNNFYDISNSTVDSVDVINQLKDNDQEGESYKTSLTFTEKLTKTLSISTNYDFAINNVKSKLNSFNEDGTGDYNVLDSVFSNNLKYDVTTHQGGLSFGYKKDKTNITLGSKVAFSNLQQNNIIINDLFERSFVNFVPTANFQYRFTQQKSISFGYNGTTRQPSVNQLQPVLNNNNPLYITLGNRDLDIAFNHRFNVSFNSYKVLTSRSIYFYSSYRFTNNDIISNVTTNDNGASIATFSNLEGKSTNNFYFWGGYGTKIGKSKIYWRSGLDVNGSTYYNISNGQLNTNKRYSFNPSFDIYGSLSDKFTLSFSLRPGYNINKSSLQPLRNANGYSFNSNGDFSYKLMKKVIIKLNYWYEFQEKTVAFNTNFDRFRVNSSISKSFLKNDNIKFELSANDLFNQNIGFNRSINGNYISQSTYNTIQRYFLGTLSWDFSKFGTKK